MVASDDDRNRAPGVPPRDLEAFEGIIREHQKMIDSLCYRMTGSLADAEDLSQETFIHAYRHWAEFRGEARVSSWLYRIAINRCLNWRKRRQRQEELNRKWAEESVDAAPAIPPEAQRVQEALMKLDPKQRAAIVLTVYDGLNHAEAARALGCSEPTISWRVFAARRKLKRWLKQPGGAHE